MVLTDVSGAIDVFRFAIGSAMPACLCLAVTPLTSVKIPRLHKEKIFAVQGACAPAQRLLWQAYATRKRGKFFLVGSDRPCKLKLIFMQKPNIMIANGNLFSFLCFLVKKNS